MQKESYNDVNRMSAFSAFQNQSMEEDKEDTREQDYESPRYFTQKVIHRHDASDQKGYSIPKDVMSQLIISSLLTPTEKAYIEEQQLAFELASFKLGPTVSQDGEFQLLDTLKKRSLQEEEELRKHFPSSDPILAILNKAKPHLKKQQHKQKRTNKVVEFSLKEVMEGLQRKQWFYIRPLLMYLRHEGPFEYCSFPGFYDELAKALPLMNTHSVDGLMQIYKLTTIWLDLYPPTKHCGTYSRFMKDSKEHVFQHGVPCLLSDRYNPVHHDMRRWFRVEPQGDYSNITYVMSWQIPVNIVYGSQESLRLLISFQKCRIKEVFELPAVQGYINYKWDQSRHYLLAEALLHLILLVSFNIYATTREGRSSDAVEIVSLFLIYAFFLREVFQLIGRRVSYWLRVYSYFDMAKIVCCAVSIHASDVSQIGWATTLGLILLYARTVTYLRLWKATRPLILQISQTLFIILPFLGIVVVSVLALASCYVASYEPNQLKLLDYSTRMFRGYQILLGQIQDPQNGPHYLSFIVISVFTGVVLLTMLVGVIVRSQNEIDTQEMIWDYKERLETSIDLETIIFLCRRKKKLYYNIGLARRASGFLHRPKERIPRVIEEFE